MLSVDSMLTRVNILYSTSNMRLVIKALEYWGSKGNLLISIPNSVILPSSSKA